MKTAAREPTTADGVICVSACLRVADFCRLTGAGRDAQLLSLGGRLVLITAVGRRLWVVTDPAPATFH